MTEKSGVNAVKKSPKTKHDRKFSWCGTNDRNLSAKTEPASTSFILLLAARKFAERERQLQDELDECNERLREQSGEIERLGASLDAANATIACLQVWRMRRQNEANEKFGKSKKNQGDFSASEEVVIRYFLRRPQGYASVFTRSLACVPCSLPLWQRCTLCCCLLRLWRRHLAWTRLILCVKTKMFQTNVPRRDAPRAEPHSRKRSLSLDEVLKFVVRVYSELSSSAVAISPYFAEIVALTSNFTIQFSIEFAKPSRRP